MAVAHSGHLSVHAQVKEAVGRGRGGAAKGVKKMPKTHVDPLSAERTRFLVDWVGARALAGWVGVSASQPTRWAKGEERPGPVSAPLLIDLEHVLARARLVWGDEAAILWLTGHNSYLEGARPIDVLKIRGAAAVLEALDAEMWGGAA